MKPDITGLLWRDDSDILYGYARRCIGNAIEIGSFRGASTVIIAQGLKDGNGGLLLSIDPYDNIQTEAGAFIIRQYNRLSNMYNKWIQHRNIRKYSVGDTVLSYAETSYDIARSLSDDQFGLIFIDGDHSYPAVKVDLQMYIPKLRSGGILICHDKNIRDVRRAVYEEVTDERFTDIRRDIENSTIACVAMKR